MKYIPEIILAISTCALGIGASAFIKEDNRHIICNYSVVLKKSTG